MSRAPLPIGTWGSISTRVAKTNAKGKPVNYLSKANLRDHDGHVRDVTAFGKTKTAAERRLLQKLQDRAKTNQAGELTAMHKIDHLLDLWEKRFERLIADGKRAPTSLDTYRRALKNHNSPRPRQAPHRRCQHPTYRHRPHQDQEQSRCPHRQDLACHHLRCYEAETQPNRSLHQATQDCG